MLLNGFKLPDSFVALIDRPQPELSWALIGMEEAVEEGEPFGDPVIVELYKRGLIEEETSQLPKTFRMGGSLPEEIEALDDENRDEPGFIPTLTDFSQTVCFGRTPSGELFCFDYRENRDEPSVIYWNDSYWQWLAPNFDTFISRYQSLFDAPQTEGVLSTTGTRQQAVGSSCLTPPPIQLPSRVKITVNAPDGDSLDLIPPPYTRRFPGMEPVPADLAERAAEPVQCETLRQLYLIGYMGTMPESEGDAIGVLCRATWLRERPTKLQIVLLQLFCEEEITPDELRRRYPNRWLAGCWLREHLPELDELGDLRFFL
jgi:hypothetical protein